MKKLSAIFLLVGICVSFNAYAWFFFFIPGSVISKISDSVTGAEGDNCVGQQVQVGDAIRIPNGSVMTVKSLSGKSDRCSDSNLPIRALLEPRASTPTANTNVSQVAFAVTTEARLELPDGWEARPLTDALKAGRNVLFTGNKTLDAGLLLATTSRAGITDVETYATTRRAVVANLLQDATQSPVTQLTINGASAWQFEISGKTTRRIPIALTAEGTPMTILQTVYEGSKEIVILNSWATAANYPNQKAELQRIANSLTGIAPTDTANSSMPSSPTPTSVQKPTKSLLDSAQSDAASRLTALKSLLDQGLITKDDYEAKKQEILKSM